MVSSEEIRNALGTLMALRDELVDAAISGNIQREHHLKSALEGFKLVTSYQEVIEDLREWLTTVKEEEDGNSAGV